MMESGDQFSPLDAGCPTCGAVPGRRCVSVTTAGRGRVMVTPHVVRVTAARQQHLQRQAGRIPACTSDAWTCPRCDRSYHPPKGWELELWPAIRRTVQELHRDRHAAEQGSV